MKKKKRINRQPGKFLRRGAAATRSYNLSGGAGSVRLSLSKPKLGLSKPKPGFLPCSGAFPSLKIATSKSSLMIKTKALGTKVDHQYFVYILRCREGSYYTGITNNIERRLWEHETGYHRTCYTINKRPLELKYCERFQSVKQAIAWEKKLKGWSRKKKEALFGQEWEELKRLSKSRGSSGVSTDSDWASTGSA